MDIGLYLAMTQGEFAAAPVLPGKPVWLGCRFSPEEGTLTSLPPVPSGALMVNDSLPFSGCNPDHIIHTLRQHSPVEVLILDFQQPGIPEQQTLVLELVREMDFPVIVSDSYAQNLSCPVFLSPCPHHVHLKDHIAPWKGREIWLDLAMDASCLTLTKEGCAVSPLPCGAAAERSFADERLHCHYRAETGDDFARFILWRTREDLQHLTREAEGLGIKALVGLWQEWQKPPCFSARRS